MSGKKSILALVRAAGYDKGYLHGRQIYLLERDQAFEQGRESVAVPARWPAFVIGALFGSGLALIARALL